MSKFKTNVELALEEEETFKSKCFKCTRIHDIQSELKSNTGYAIKQAIKYSKLDTVEKSQILESIYNEQLNFYHSGYEDTIVHLPHGTARNVSLYEAFIDSTPDIDKVLLKIENSVSKTPPFGANLQPHYVKLDSSFISDFWTFNLYKENERFEKTQLEMLSQKIEKEEGEVHFSDNSFYNSTFEHYAQDYEPDDMSNLEDTPNFSVSSFKKKWLESYRNHDYPNLIIGNRIATAAASIAGMDLRTSDTCKLTTEQAFDKYFPEMPEKYQKELSELISKLNDYSNDSADMAEKIAKSKLKNFSIREDFKEEVSLDSPPADGAPIV